MSHWDNPVHESTGSESGQVVLSGRHAADPECAFGRKFPSLRGTQHQDRTPAPDIGLALRQPGGYLRALRAPCLMTRSHCARLLTGHNLGPANVSRCGLIPVCGARPVAAHCGAELVPSTPNPPIQRPSKVFREALGSTEVNG